MQNINRTEERLPLIAGAVRDLIRSHTCKGTVTLDLNVGTTTVSHPAIFSGAHVTLTARHANAATEVGNGTIYVSSVADGSFVITHANAATANRTFSWAAVTG